MAEITQLTGNMTLREMYPEVNANVTKVNAEITSHKASEQAHAADAITYEGGVTGAVTVKQAVDNVQTQIDTLVVNGDSSPAAAQAAIDADGHDYGNLKVRLDTEHTALATQLAEKANQTEVDELSNVKANISYVNSKLQGVSLSYKESYATLSDLQNAYPAGNEYNHVVLADNMIYTWANDTWTNTQIQANGTGLADDSVSLNSIGDDVTNWNGVRVYAATASSESVIFIEKVFDLEGLLGSITNILSAYQVDFEYFTNDNNITNINTRIFFNNDSTLGVITPVDYISTVQVASTKNKIANYSRSVNYLNPDGKRYAHVMIRLYVVNKNLLTEAFLRNLTLKAGTGLATATGTGYALFSQTPDSIIESVGVAPFNLPKMKDLQPIITQILTEESPNLLRTKWYGKKIAFLGDSITYGHTGPSSPSKRYSTLVCNVLVATELNHGVNGTRIARQNNNTNNFAMRYVEMDDDADLIIVFGGINDFYSGTAEIGTKTSTDITTFYGALNVLMTGLKSKYPGKDIVFITPIQSYYAGKTTDDLNATTNEPLKTYRDAIIERAEYYGIPVLDLYSVSGIDAAHITSDRTAYMSDGLHPNDHGNQRIADRVIGFLKSL